MKNFSVLFFVVVIVLVLILCSVSFQVRETQNALVTRFGNVSRTITEPGFYWKWPKPIESVRKFDSRSNLLVGKMEETTTGGTETISVTSYMVWKIAEPRKYLETLKNESEAVDQLESLLRNTQNTVIGQHYFSEFVNTDIDKIKLAQIEDSMHESLQKETMDKYGIDIEVVGIRQLGVSKDVTPDAFERMKSERLRKKENIISQGKADAKEIKSDAESKSTQLLAVVEAYAKEIRGEGDAQAAQYYEMLEEDPEFAMYLQDLETLKTILKEKSTIVLGSETDLINLLKGIPDIKPKKESASGK